MYIYIHTVYTYIFITWLNHGFISKAHGNVYAYIYIYVDIDIDIYMKMYIKLSHMHI
jgi:hypothetical protein